MTSAEAGQLFAAELGPLYSKEEAKALVVYVLHHLEGINRPGILLRRNKQLASETEESLLRIVGELKAGKPVQYILGEAEFYRMRYKVNPSVLIPRPETEELVDWVLKGVGSRERGAGSGEGGKLSILDIGTGSGCIAVTLKKKLPAASVYGLDVSAEALKTAAQNALLNGADVKFLQVNILNGAMLPGMRFSVIVSNPPYITVNEKTALHRNVVDNEPHTALFVEDDDPLIFYRHIAEFAVLHLLGGGLLFFEINEAYGSQVAGLLQKRGFSEIELRKDMQGKDRMICARLNKPNGS